MRQQRLHARHIDVHVAIDRRPGQGHSSSGISRIIGTSGAGASRRLQRTWQGALGLRLELRLMAAHEMGGDDQDDDGGNDQYNHAPAGEALDLPAQRIGGGAEEYRPGERTEDIGQEELRPRHAIGAGHDAGDRAQNRNELGDDDDLAAVAQEQILAELDPRFVDPDIAAVAQQQPIAEITADQIADAAADDRGDRRRQDHRDDAELVLGAGNDRGDDQGGLARHRKTDAFQADGAGDHEQAVGVNKMGYGWHEGCVFTRATLTYTHSPGKRTP